MAKAIKITTEWEDIGPERAAEYLLKNTENRPVSKARVDEWATEIADGKWRETHQGIAFDLNGKLIDGQHRLLAIIKAGATIRVMVTRGLDPATIKVIDDGMARDAAALVTVEFRRKFGNTPANVRTVTSIAFGCLQGFTHATIHKEEIAEHAIKHFKLISEMIPLVFRSSAGSAHAAGAFVNAALYFGRDRVMALAERFKSEMWASTSDPLKALHTRFIRSKMKQTRADALDKHARYALTVSAIRPCLMGADRVKLAVTTQDFGEADVDKRVRRGLPPEAPVAAAS